MMDINSAQFIISNTDYLKCPAPKFPEYAFIGRSNVGKSSLINMLTGRTKLAKTSGKPGKTQLINHFLINEEWYLVDLPGYGWAQVSKAMKADWETMIKDYLLKRENLFCVFVLVDSRLEPQKIDLELLQWLGEHELPVAIVFTKADKLSRNKTQKNVSLFKKALSQTWAQFPPLFLTSSETGLGRDEALSFIDAINKNG